MNIQKQPKKPVKASKGRGRPSAYRAIYTAQAAAFCLLGADDRKLCELFEISEKTLHNWKARHPDFLQAIKSGKDVADAQVAGALFRAATQGAITRETKIDIDGQASTIVRELAPDTTAAIFWLKNRQPALWREKQQMAVELEYPNEDVLNAIFEEAMKKTEKMRLEVNARRF